MQGGGERIGIEAVIMGDDNVAVIDVHLFDASYIHSGVFQLVGVVSGEAAGVVEGLWHGALLVRGENAPGGAFSFDARAMPTVCRFLFIFLKIVRALFLSTVAARRVRRRGRCLGRLARGGGCPPSRVRRCICRL